MLLPWLFWALLLCTGKANTEDPSPASRCSFTEKLVPEYSPSLLPPSILYEENFEGPSAFDRYVKRQFASPYAFSLVTHPVFAGQQSGRFELRDSDTLNNDGTRAEVSFPVQTGSHRWYSFTGYFPSASYQFDNSDEVITQWHQGGGYSPALSLRTREDQLMLYFKPTPKTTEKIKLGQLPKDKWVSFVFHINHSSEIDGFLEIYQDGKKIYSRTGPVMYEVGVNNARAPKWKLGIYKSDWNRDKTTDTKLRVYYIDNVRIGDETASLAKMLARAIDADRSAK